MDGIERVSVSDLLDRSVDHEKWLTPLDANLRTSLYWCGGGMALAIPVGFLGTPLLLSWSYDGFFFFLGPLAVFLLDILRSTVWIGVNIVGLLLFGLLYWQSEKLTAAVVPWHWLGMALVGIGAIDILAMTLPLAIVAVNLVAWIILAVLALALFFLALAVAGSSD